MMSIDVTVMLTVVTETDYSPFCPGAGVLMLLVKPGVSRRLAFPFPGDRSLAIWT